MREEEVAVEHVSAGVTMCISGLASPPMSWTVPLKISKYSRVSALSAVGDTLFFIRTRDLEFAEILG